MSTVYPGSSHAKELVDHTGYLHEGTYDRAEILSTVLLIIVHSPRWDAFCISPPGGSTFI